jgi:hypothetical protein
MGHSFPNQFRDEHGDVELPDDCFDNCQPARRGLYWDNIAVPHCGERDETEVAEQEVPVMLHLKLRRN